MINGDTVRCDTEGCASAYRDRYGLDAGEHALLDRSRNAGWSIFTDSWSQTKKGIHFCPDHNPVIKGHPRNRGN